MIHHIPPSRLVFRPWSPILWRRCGFRLSIQKLERTCRSLTRLDAIWFITFRRPDRMMTQKGRVTSILGQGMFSPIKNDQQAYTRPNWRWNVMNHIASRETIFGRSFVGVRGIFLPWVILRREGRHDHIFRGVGLMPLYGIWTGHTHIWERLSALGFWGALQTSHLLL
jgi:hypothetical protein